MSAEDTEVAAYVLGVLPTDERQLLEQRLSADPELRRERDLWECRLAPLQNLVEPQRPPDRVWKMIRDRVESRRTGSLAKSWWLPAALTAMLAIGAVGLNWQREPEVSWQAVALQAEDGARWDLRWSDAQPDLIQAELVSAHPPAASQDHELWLIVPEGPGPRSLGLLPREAGEAAILRWPGFRADATLAVSLEPRGGSPTAVPTGPVIAVLALQGA